MLDTEDRLNLAVQGINRGLIFTNESGLYSLVLRSRKPEAKAFKKWVTSEVLPTIRKTGMYMTQKVAVEAVEDPSTFLARALVVAQGGAAISIAKIRGGIQYAPGAAFPPCPPTVSYGWPAIVPV